MAILREASAVLAKDLKIELRSGELLISMLLFSVLVVLVFSFAFVRGGAPLPDVAAGILWVSLAFAGTLGLSRAWDREREADGLRALLLSPAERPAIYLGKALGIFFFLLVTSTLIVPLVAVLFDVPLFLHGGWLLLTLLLGLLGFSVVGAFFGALMARSQARDLLLFIVLYPLLMPLFISGVMATTQAFSAEPHWDQLNFFLTLLGVFDVLMFVGALWTFERLVID
ncbi:MAG: heme exporter protein CcmB [Deltaproteobacteria bacterium]|nr:heme exporter protein CcmB [Deltaproteobacteria bacterium]